MTLRAKMDKMYDDLPGLLARLTDMLDAPRGEHKLTAISTIVHKLVDKVLVPKQASPSQDGFTTAGGAHITRGLPLQGRNQFVRLGGTPIVLRVLLETRDDAPQRGHWLSLANDCLFLLRELCVAFYDVANDMSTHESILPDLFDLMRKRTTFSNAVQLVEETIAAKPDILDIRSLPPLQEFVECLDPFQVAYFSRLLALMVFDQDEAADNAQGLADSKRGKEYAVSPQRTRTIGVVARNRQVLLDSPGLIGRLVHLIQSPDTDGPAQQYRSGAYASHNDTLAGLLQAFGSAGLPQPFARMFQVNRPGQYDEPQPPVGQPQLPLHTPFLAPPPEVQAARGANPPPVPSPTLRRRAAAQAQEKAAAAAADLRPQQRLGQPGAADGNGRRDQAVGGGGELLDYNMAPASPVAVAPAAEGMDVDVAPGAPRDPPAACGSTGDGDPGEPALWERMHDLELTMRNGQGVTALELPELARVEPVRPIRWTEDLTIEAWDELQYLRDAIVTGAQRDEEERSARGQEGEGEGEEGATSRVGAADYHILLLSTYQVEALFVLSSLMSGKRKQDAQGLIARLGVVPRLSALFDHLQWGRLPPKTHPDHGIHGPNCECNPETGLKVQYLRMIHNFCDSPKSFNHKRLLLTPAELAELQLLADDFGMDAALCPMPAEASCSGEVGLLAKMARAFQGEPRKSPFRSFLARAIEGYLRGAPSIDRVFLMRRGLVRFCVEEIREADCSDKPTDQTILQYTFDLLAELCRFCPPVFAHLNELLVTQDPKVNFGSFINLATRNLVASTMFLRVVILSTQHFQRIGLYGVRSCRLHNFISDLGNRATLLRDVLLSLAVTDITEDNKCCLNTALILLLIVRREGELPDVLKALRAHELRQGRPGHVLERLQELLRFWKLYYGARNQDCVALEQSSHMGMAEWRSGVDLLLGDGESASSIAHWLDDKSAAVW